MVQIAVSTVSIPGSSHTAPNAGKRVRKLVNPVKMPCAWLYYMIRNTFIINGSFFSKHFKDLLCNYHLLDWGVEGRYKDE